MSIFQGGECVKSVHHQYPLCLPTVGWPGLFWLYFIFICC